jgi:hypothetical protein
VRDAIDPCTQRAATVEAGEAAPKREMNLLQQVATAVAVWLVGSCQPIERRAVDGGRLPVQVLGPPNPCRIACGWPQVSFPDGTLLFRR